jgi:MoxR-like ATPase
VTVSPEVAGYVVDIARATRVSPSLSLGVSPRGATALMRTSRAWAWLQGRTFVTPDDVKAIAPDVLRHRVLTSFEADAEEVTSDDVVARVLAAIETP